ncbi:hypothetical protein [Natrarchaeobaculum sulfurireducens]|nr:hypothetical protein [Natrarchaeobaculum sulfurireducens]
MSQTKRERVTDMLETADRESGALLSTDEALADGSLLEVAEAASEFLESNDPQAVLEAVGLDMLPDGSEPESIPAAIVRGDEREVEALKRMMNLAKLADDADGDALADATAPLRDRLDDAAELEGETAEADGDATSESGANDADDATDNSEEDDDQVDETDAADDADDSGSVLESLADGLVGDESTAEEATAEETADVGDALEDAVRSSVTEFGDDVQRLRDRLETARTDESAEEKAGEDDDERTAEDENASEAGESDDLLEVDLGGDRADRSSSRGVVRHSTVAPSPSDRADMKGTARFSTMPEKND